MKKQLLNPALTGLLSACIILFVSFVFSGLFKDWEAKTLDYRYQIRGDIPTDPDIILIDCDDKSLKSIGRWPWKRSVHAEMIDLLSKSGAKIIAYDILFNKPSEDTEDNALIQAVKKAGTVVLPVGLELKENRSETIPAITEETRALKQFALPAMPNNISGFPVAARAVSVLPQLASSALSLGHISANRDKDGIIRRVPLITNIDGALFPSLGLITVSSFLNIDQQNISVGTNKITLKQLLNNVSHKLNETEIPIAENGMMFINYAGRWVDTFNHYSFVDILNMAETDSGKKELKKIFSGKLCLIANTATGFDIKSIPIEKDYPGGGILANIINTILTKNFIKEIDPVTKIALVLIFGILAGLISSSKSRWTGTLLLSLMAASYFGGTILIFNFFGLILPVLTPLLTLVLTNMLVSAYSLKISQKKVTNLLAEKETLRAELKTVNLNLHQKGESLETINKDLRGLRNQIKKNSDRGNNHLNQIAEFEAKIEQIIKERDKLKEKKELLDKRLADIEVNEPEFRRIDSSEFNKLQAECASYGIITNDKKVIETFRLLKKAALVDSPILILGEPGTGKELFAKAVHKLSRRKSKSMITVNLPAVSENLVESELFGHMKGSFTGAASDKKGKFEQAQEGTIFLDEIGEMKLDLQSKLLRVLQNGEIDPVGGKTKKVNVRIIAATNKNLEEETKSGGFRPDLYSRLNVITVTLPPLRERPDDIVPITEFYVMYFNKLHGKDISGISTRGMEALKRHTWENGNIRELKNAIDRGITFTEDKIISEKDLGLPNLHEHEESPPKPLDQVDMTEDLAFLTLMRQNGFEINSAAHALNNSRGTVASRFKGLCLQYLVKEEMDITLTTRKIAGSKEYYPIVEKKVQGYYKNLVDICSKFNNSEEAKKECLKRFKNIPQIYHSAVEEIIERHFNS